MQIRFIVYDMKCAVGRKGVFYEVFQMAADIGCVRMYGGHRRIGMSGDDGSLFLGEF